MSSGLATRTNPVSAPPRVMRKRTRTCKRLGRASGYGTATGGASQLSRAARVRTGVRSSARAALSSRTPATPRRQKAAVAPCRIGSRVGATVMSRQAASGTPAGGQGSIRAPS